MLGPSRLAATQYQPAFGDRRLLLLALNILLNLSWFGSADRVSLVPFLSDGPKASRVLVQPYETIPARIPAKLCWIPGNPPATEANWRAHPTSASLVLSGFHMLPTSD